MRLTFFGVRGSCPCSSDQYRRYGGNTSCLLVEVDGEPPLIVDLGTGLRALGDHLEKPLRASGMPLRANALLTHLHFDHVLGLPFFAPMRDPGAVLDVYGPSQQGASLHDVLAGMVKPPFFPIHMAEFRGCLFFHDLDDKSEVSLGSVTVKVRAVPHIGHTLGFRLEADGRSLAYLSDHQAPVDRRSVDAGVLDLCRDADLVVHDAQYTDDEFVLHSDWGHSTPAYAVHVAREAGARRLALFHYDPAHADRDVERMLTQARRLAGGRGVLEVEAASEGT
ncbi:MAG TPA: MBL fold metallo-hydrolase, partial [Acidimicrobiales bacterium]|nr:MBL fold metallo-hydrolase [Acidimicrobiales bacterium]